MDEFYLTPGTEEYRKARRRRQNRESASRVRAQKKEHLEAINEKLTSVKTSNSEMEIEISRLQAENQALRNGVNYNDKGSYVYANAALIISILGIIFMQNYTSWQNSQGTWSTTIFLGFIIIILLIK